MIIAENCRIHATECRVLVIDWYFGPTITWTINHGAQLGSVSRPDWSRWLSSHWGAVGGPFCRPVSTASGL